MSLHVRPPSIGRGKLATKERIEDIEEPESRCIGFPYSAYDAQSVEEESSPRPTSEADHSKGSSSKASSSEVSPGKKLTRFERPSEDAVNPLDDFCARNPQIWSCGSNSPHSVRETILETAARRRLQAQVIPRSKSEADLVRKVSDGSLYSRRSTVSTDLDSVSWPLPPKRRRRATFSGTEDNVMNKVIDQDNASSVDETQQTYMKLDCQRKAAHANANQRNCLSELPPMARVKSVPRPRTSMILSMEQHSRTDGPIRRSTMPNVGRRQSAAPVGILKPSAESAVRERSGSTYPDSTSQTVGVDLSDQESKPAAQSSSFPKPMVRALESAPIAVDKDPHPKSVLDRLKVFGGSNAEEKKVSKRRSVLNLRAASQARDKPKEEPEGSASAEKKLHKRRSSLLFWTAAQASKKQDEQLSGGATEEKKLRRRRSSLLFWMAPQLSDGQNAQPRTAEDSSTGESCLHLFGKFSIPPSSDQSPEPCDNSLPEPQSILRVPEPRSSEPRDSGKRVSWAPELVPSAVAELPADVVPHKRPRASTHLGLPPVLHINTHNDEDAEAWSRRLSSALDLDVVLAAHDAAMSKRRCASSSARGIVGSRPPLPARDPKRRNTWGYYPMAMYPPNNTSINDRGRYRKLSWEAISPLTLVEGEKGTIPAAALVCGRCGASAAASVVSFETAREYSNEAAQESSNEEAEEHLDVRAQGKAANRLDSGV